MPAGLALLEFLTDAEDGPEAVGEGEDNLFIEGGGGLVVVLPALGVAEDYILTAGRCEHCRRYLAGVGSLVLVSAVLCGEGCGSALDDAAYAVEMCEGGGEYQLYVRGDFIDSVCDVLCKCGSLIDEGVHFPVAGYDFLSHKTTT